MKTLKIITGLLLLSLCSLNYSFAGNITWTGGTSTSWTTASNFSPAVVPGTSDTVTIVTGSGYDPVLQGNVELHKLLMQSGTLDLNGYELEINDYAEFSGGIVTNGLITVNGNLAIFSGTEMDAEVETYCGGVQLSGSEFNEPCYFESRASSSSSGEGGNIFNAPVTIYHVGTTEHFYMAVTYGDLFNDSLTIINASSMNIYPSGDDSSTYKSAVIISSLSSGTIQFSRNGGVSALIDDAYIEVDSNTFNSGTLILAAIDQTTSNTNELYLTGSATLNIIDCEFDGSIEATSPDILFKDNVFNGVTQFEKTGGTNNQCVGNNTFNNVTTVTNTSSYGLRLAVSSSDLFTGDITFVGSSGSLTSGYGVISKYQGDVTANGDAVYLKYAEITGINNQTLNGTSDHDYNELTLNKPSGTLIANTPITVIKSVNFTEGILQTDTVNLITFNEGSSADYASDTSYIDGPIKKIGETAFEFPLGSENLYFPLSITAPDTITDAFVAEYFSFPHEHGANSDTTLGAISYCNYWNLNRKIGNSNVKVTIGWNEYKCALVDSGAATIAYWNLIAEESDSIWKNLSVDTLIGTSSIGKMSSLNSIGGTNVNLTIAYEPFAFSSSPVEVEATGLAYTYEEYNRFFGLNGTNTLSSETSWDNTSMNEAVSKLMPGLIRYPGGSISNLWDWQRGWFIEPNEDFQYCPGLSSYFESLEPLANTLENFSEALGINGAEPLFVLNMLTSNIPMQIAMLHEAEILGLPVRRVELGNEFYRDPQFECEYNEIFPLASDYATESEDWVDAIEERFSEATCAILGARVSPTNLPRQANWNTDVESSLTFTPGAITFHPYFGAGLSFASSLDPCSPVDFSDNITNYTHQWQSMFDKTISGLKEMKTGEAEDLSGGTTLIETWMTEYNLFYQDKYILHGSWAHALQVAMATMTMMEEEYISNVLCHTMVGDAKWSSFFGSTNGYDYGNDPAKYCGPQDFGTSAPVPPPTTLYGYTSLGMVLSELGEAFRFADQVQSLNISKVGIGDLPHFEGGNNVPAIQGWKFIDSNDGGEQAHYIIFNFSDDDIEMDMDLGGNQVPQKMKVVTLGNTNDVNTALYRFIVGTDFSQEPELLTIIESNSSNSAIIRNTDFPSKVDYDPDLVIPKFSVVSYYYAEDGAQQNVRIYSSTTEVCGDRDFYLYADASAGATSYDWYEDGSNLITTTTVPFLKTSFNGDEDPHTYDVIVSFGPNGVDGTKSSSNDITVNYKKIPTLTLTSDPDPEICYSAVSPITLSADLSDSDGDSNDFRYCWISTDENLDQNQQLTYELDVSPKETTTYTVYATDGLCSVREDILITVGAEAYFEKDPIYFCDGASSITFGPEVPVGNSYTYEWSDMSTNETITISNPSSGSTVYTLTVTDNSLTSTCITEIPVTIISKNCCTSTADLVIAINFEDKLNSDALIQAVQNVCTACVVGDYVITGIPTTFESIRIDGDLIVDKDLVIEGIDFIMSDRSEIVVENYRQLTLKGCTFEGCTNMWKGIRVKQNGSIITRNLNSVNTLIADAYQGIDMDNWTKASIIRTNFVDNYIGFNSSANANVIHNNPFLKEFNQVNFNSTSLSNSLLNEYTNIPALPSVGDISFAGIIAENDVLIIKNTNTISTLSSINEFSQLCAGIVANNSMINIKNTSFSDFIADGAYNSVYRQHGIVNDGQGNSAFASIKIEGLGNQTWNNDDETFENVSVGVRTISCAIDVSKSIFLNVDNGIIVMDNRFQKISIDQNYMESNVSGIELLGNDLAMDIKVTKNELHINQLSTGAPYEGGGILARFNGLNSSWNQFEISCNDIYMNEETDFGILLSGFSHIGRPIGQPFKGISDNDMFIHDANDTEGAGIYLENSHHNKVTFNEVIHGSAYDASHLKFGIHLNTSTNNIIQQNETNYTDVGIRFEGDCNMPDMLLGNKMGDHNHGMELVALPFGQFGVQNHTGNEWVGSYTNNIGAWTNITIPSMMQNSQINYNSSDASASTTANNGVWFNLDNNTANQIFNPVTECSPQNIPRELSLQELDSLITIDSIYADTLQSEARWIAKYNLMHKLNLILLESSVDSIYEAFLDSMELYPLGKFIYYMDSLEIETTIGADSSEYIAVLDSSLHSQFELYDLEISENERITLEQNIGTKQQELNILWENSISQFEDNINDKYAGLINGITSSNTIESNFKDYYSMLFDYYAGDFNLSSAMASLNTIAYQCPAAGGPAVFYARNLIAMLDTARVYDDETLCGSSSRISSPEIPVIENRPLIMVFPNPFTSNININILGFSLPPDLHIEIMDVSGRLIKSSVIRKAPFLSSIDFSNLESGGYHLRIKSLDNHTEYINQILIKVD